MIEWYYVLGIISYGLFLIQWILSMCGFDWDIDFDLDGDIDVFGSDIVSFKGLIHFLMGFSGWLMATDYSGFMPFTIWTYLGAICIGTSLMIVLYFLYKLMMKLNETPIQANPEDLIGQIAVVSYANKNCGQAKVYYSGETYTITIYAKSGNKLKTGGYYRINEYSNNKFYV